MSLIRPEAAATLHRWRDVLAGGALLVLGLWWAGRGHGVLPFVGWALVLAGVGLALTGIRRARFDQGAGGPGVVRIDEGAIAWFGPYGGGVAALSEIARLELDRSATPPRWRLHTPGQDSLDIPVTAEGSQALFDAFAMLPGLNTPKMLAELRARHKNVVVIWQRPMQRLR